MEGTARQRAERAGRGLRRLAGVVVVGGLLGAFGWFNYALTEQTNAVNEFIGMPPRSGGTVEIPEAGVYTLWAGAACGGFCDIPPREELHELMVVGFEGPGGEVRPEPFPGESSYQVDGHRKGEAAWLVEFDEPGTYVVQRENHGVGATLLNLGRGEGMPAQIREGVIAIVGAATLVAVGLWVVGRHRQRAAIRQLMQGLVRQ